MNHGKSDAEKARCLNASYDQKTIQDRLRADRRATAVVRATRRNRQGTRNSIGNVVARYRRLEHTHWCA